MADLINATDSLNTGRVKINAIIKDASAAVVAAESASATAGEAKTTANSVQTQLDTIILVDGASDAEVVQSRVDKDGKLYATLKERLDSSDAQLAQIWFDFRVYGGVGDGVSDNTTVLKHFLSLGGNLKIPKGVYMVNADTYSMVSNTTLLFEQGAKLKLLPHNTNKYAILNIYNIENVKVIDAVLDGNKNDNQMIVGEWGHGFNIVNSKHITIEKAKVINTFGDGVYIGHEYYGESTQVTEDILVENVIVDGARRNGFSVCGGSDIIINNPIIKNVTETNPKAGIDIEPEGEGGVKALLKNVLINNPQITNCAIGIELNLNLLIDRGLEITITINKPIFQGVGCPITIRALEGVLRGSVQFNDVQATDTCFGVIYLSGYLAENTPPITINGLKVRDFNTHQSEDAMYNHLITITNSVLNPATADIGNITINNLDVYDNVNPLFRFIHAQLGNSVHKIKHVRITNPSIHTVRPFVNFIRGNPDLKVLDGLKEFTLKPTYFTYQLDQYLPSYVDNRNMVDWLELHTNDEWTPLGYTVQIVVAIANRVIFRPTTKIIGRGTTNGKGIYSANAGDSVTLMYTEIGWIIKNMVGTWENEV